VGITPHQLDRCTVTTGEVVRLQNSPAVPSPALIPDQAAPIAAEVAQPPDRLGLNEARPAHTPLDDLGQPHRVELAGLRPAGHGLDVSGVEQSALEALGLEQ